MTDQAAPEARGISVRSMEAVTAFVLAALGGLAILDSQRLGSGWGSDGPQAGYFPFWLGALLVLASAVNLAQAVRLGRSAGLFVSFAQLRLVLAVLVPTTVYVIAIPFIGLYVASTLFVTFFMARLGGFRWWVAALSGLATSAIVFVTFELWFLVPLPKGPLETALGY